VIRYNGLGLYLRAPIKSQLNLPHGSKQKSIMKKLKTKNRDAQEKRSSNKVRDKLYPVMGVVRVTWLIFNYVAANDIFRADEARHLVCALILMSTSVQ